VGGRQTRAWRAALCVPIVLLVAVTPASASSFCENGRVHDYLRPLEGLPSLTSEPVGQQVPFAPHDLSFGVSGPDTLAIGKQKVGYYLDYTPTATHPTSRDLGWLVTAKLTRINSAGRMLERVGFKRVRGLRSHRKYILAFELSSEPALYRLEVVFRNSSGKRLGRYGRYLRVLEPQAGPHLTLFQSAYRPGETVAPRLENEGTGWLFYGLGYRIEEFNGSDWVPTSLGPKAFLLIGLSSGPGETASCWRFTIPADTASGQYRLLTSIDVSKEPSLREPAEKTFLTAEFEVVP
jgi:hypothetical protein